MHYFAGDFGRCIARLYAAMQIRAAECHVLRQRYHEFAYAVETKRAASTHDGRHGNTRTLRQLFDRGTNGVLRIMHDQVGDALLRIG